MQTRIWFKTHLILIKINQNKKLKEQNKILMKKLTIKGLLLALVSASSLTGCYKLQKDYDYEPQTLDPNINMTAKDFMHSRGIGGTGSDTVFKWMELGVQYAGIDLTEYEKKGRTYIFLHNNAVRTLSSGKVNGGFFFDYPIVVKDSTGAVIKSKIDVTQDSLRPAVSWNEYPQAMVRNYFLYLILNGEYSFENLTVNNTTIQTLMPPGQSVSATDSKLGWVVTKTTPNPDAAAAASIYFQQGSGTGFDPEGKINLKLINNQNAPINVNDRLDDRTAGYFATNGKVHVFDKSVPPFRYSYP
jgi:hypothetical protein